MDFKFLFPGEFIVQRGALAGIGGILKKHMKKPCVFHYGKAYYSSGTDERVRAAMEAAGLEYAVFDGFQAEPSQDVVNEAAAFIRKNGCDGAFAVGGGSTVDAAKAACALAPNGDDIMEHVEGFDPQPFAEKPLPVVAMPTTAGTGSDCTKNSVITSRGTFKSSVRDDAMLPVATVIDAEMMLDVPRQATVWAGADCLCHLVECYTTRFANPLSDAISLYFTGMAFRALPKVAEDGSNIRERERMGICASAAGLAMSNSGLGLGHGIAAGMGALTPLAHGLICGIILPHAMRFNMSRGVLKYADIARAVTGEEYAGDVEAAEAAIRLVEELNAKIGVPPDFRGNGITKEDVKKIAKASMGSSMSKNPVEISPEDCEALLLELI